MVKEMGDKTCFFKYCLTNLHANEEQSVHLIYICIMTTIRITNNKRLFIYPTGIPEAAKSIIKHCVEGFNELLDVSHVV